MNYSSFIKILSVIAIILSACICCIKPQMHSNIVMTESSYMLADSDYKPEETKTNEVIATVSREEIQRPKLIQNNVSEPVTQVVEQKRVKTPETQKVTKKQVAQPKVNTVKNFETNKKINTTPKQERVVSKSQAKPQTKTLSEKQEEIAWNVWRSNLQNQIMKDSRLPDIPDGVVFKFSFTVDKYGKVSNVKTWSLNPFYTPIAIQYLAPVIRGYQGHSILDFPSGSNRVITNVEGGFKVSSTARYSSPSDYNDTETVRR